MLLFWAICGLHEHQFNQLRVWYGVHEMCNRQKLILYLTRGKTIFGWYQSIHLMLWNFFKESRCFVFTYLLWIFLQKNWTSFSLFSSWSSMNLEQRKIWEEVFNKDSSWLFTQKMITRSTFTNSAKDDRHSLFDDDERVLNSENQTDWWQLW